MADGSKESLATLSARESTVLALNNDIHIRSFWTVPKPDVPDGKWGWVVVFASFLMCLLMDGMVFSFGMLYIEFLNEFKASSSITSLIGSICASAPFLYCPVMSVLVDKYGCRSMSIFAGLISAIAFVISSKVSSIEIMYLTFGVLSGIGRGICYITNSVIIMFWFEKKRNLAIGVSSSGAGIGCFVFPPLTNFLIYQYGWRGATLVLGGIFFNICVSGALMIDPDYKNNFSNMIINERKIAPKNKKDRELDFQNQELSKQIRIKRPIMDNFPKSTSNLPNYEYVHEDRKYHLPAQESCLAPKLFQHTSLTSEGPQPTENIHFDWLHRSLFEHPMEHFKWNKYRSRSASCPNIYRAYKSTLQMDVNKKWYTEQLDLAKKMFDFSLLLELHLFVLCLSSVMLFAWLLVPLFYLADHMIKHGYASEATYLTVSYIGITHTIGMITLGWVGTQPWANIVKAYATCLIMGGISCAGIMFFTSNFIMLEISAGFYGLFMASTYAFTPGIVIQLVPLEKFTIAYGLVLFSSGIGIFVGPPFAGQIYDITNSWEQTFYQAALWIVMSGVIIAIISYTKNRKILGKGSVLKETEGAKDNLAVLGGFILVLLSLFATIFYFTIDCLL